MFDDFVDFWEPAVPLLPAWGAVAATESDFTPTLTATPAWGQQPTPVTNWTEKTGQPPAWS